ncbi:Transcriptional regulator, contains XRE-family HTH domain [Saccharopolyspora antimicrobica]|uniref:Transcriptional regulator with XRE-family HTH domain n=1 Tax=Saccharopolyspora antimicrobica TaxID=455193 RepID=A0A1I4R9U8_9PSEU|nr:helix-turn-helix transcriptional regulator [Saccharopolyspora antimicrobica]RKT88102.1 transcriptional regulator with XRE-family HTH domain [Saccharopolyspora antimicrobica]SFM49017.1 Transcriptional regulator, contains XRE-family HTH domain [Saccharopolyspora antimicrobica]
MSGSGHLGEFLRARRARLRPEDVGLITPPGHRRVAGLRREELAQLAGVSVSYYTRLEQHQSVNASDGVLDALARALRLDDHERAHLRELAAQRPRRQKRPPAERVDGLTRELLQSLKDMPALLVGRRTDVLAWTPQGHALLAGHIDPAAPECPGERPNLVRMLFLDPHTRDLYVDWEHKARGLVASLRLAAGRHPDDALLASLVGELSVKCPEFVAMWGDHRVKPCQGDAFRLRHPLVGELTITQQSLQIPRAPDQSIVVVTAEQGSTSADTLDLLAQLTAKSTGTDELQQTRDRARNLTS